MLMLPWTDEKYLSATPTNISVYLWWARDTIIGYKYPTIEISGGISSESGSPPIAISPRMALEAFLGVSQPDLGDGDWEELEQTSLSKTMITYSPRIRCD